MFELETITKAKLIDVPGCRLVTSQRVEIK